MSMQNSSESEGLNTSFTGRVENLKLDHSKTASLSMKIPYSKVRRVRMARKTRLRVLNTGQRTIQGTRKRVRYTSHRRGTGKCWREKRWAIVFTLMSKISKRWALRGMITGKETQLPIRSLRTMIRRPWFKLATSKLTIQSSGMIWSRLPKETHRILSWLPSNRLSKKAWTTSTCRPQHITLINIIRLNQLWKRRRRRPPQS